jgi:TPR repeat protein
MNAIEFAKLKELSLQGDNEAKYEVAIEYLNGEICNPDIAEAINLLKESSETSNRSRKILGYYYYQGKFVEQDINKAIDLFQKAGNDLDVEACHNLGVIYYSEKSVRNIKLANNWFKLAGTKNLELFKTKCNYLGSSAHKRQW